jgi:putative ABC transport system permease protein
LEGGARVRALDRKLLRDLWRLRAPLGAAALVMASGVAALVMAWSTSASLAASRARYYEEGRFGDVFAQVKRAPEFVAGRLREIDGVEMLETRIMHDVMLTVPGLDETASARLVSLPDAGEPLLNAVHLRVGRMPDPRQSEVIASEPFAAANGLRPGDTLGAVINGRWQTLTVVGIGLSPEFIYFVRAGSMLPDNRRSGVLWMPRSGLEDALGIEEQRVNVVIDFLAAPAERAALGDQFRVEARITVLAKQDVLRVPVGCLVQRGGAWSVYVVEDGVARLRAIELGERSAEHAEVTEGLTGGEAVVLFPSDRIADGVAVAPRESRSR